MAISTEKNLRSEFSKGKIPSLLLIISDDPAYLDYYQEKAIESFLNTQGTRDGINTLYGDELDPIKLLDELSLVGLFSTKKLYFLKSMERLKAKDWEAITPLLEASFEGNHVILLAQKIHGKTKFLDAISKSAKDFFLLKMEEPRPEHWDFWIQEFSKHLKISISEEAKEFLKGSTLGNLGDLKQTLEHASLFNPAVSILQKEHIVALGNRSLLESIFDLNACLLNGNKAKSLQLLGDLLASGEEPLAIVGLLNRQYRWLLGIAAGMAEGISEKEISSAVKLWPQAARILFPAARRIGGRGAIRGLKLLQEAEFSLKNSKMPSIHIMGDLVSSLLMSP